MDPKRLEYFRAKLRQQLQQHTQHVIEDQAAALEFSDDTAKDAVDASWLNVNQEIAFRLGERESRMVADIDQALLRIKEGNYGQCARCEEPINERRLEAVPTARYDTVCQTLLETELEAVWKWRRVRCSLEPNEKLRQSPVFSTAACDQIRIALRTSEPEALATVDLL